MQSVAMDIFDMPTAIHQGEVYKKLIVCVDRHSGWLITAPLVHDDAPLKTAKVVDCLYRRGWDLFGIPSVIRTDSDSKWLSCWWKTLCARLGVQHAVSQPYHHRANGRAEKAGQQLIDMLRKLCVEQVHFTWVEALPQALRRIHVLSGESGYSPYEIVFGRTRALASLPYQPPHESLEASDFIMRQHDIGA
jgi:hypothetical protein